MQVQTGDRAERQSALHQALTRMAERPGAAIDPDAWIDTEPQVALGQAQNFAATMPFELDTSTLRH